MKTLFISLVALFSFSFVSGQNLDRSEEYQISMIYTQELKIETTEKVSFKLRVVNEQKEVVKQVDNLIVNNEKTFINLSSLEENRYILQVIVKLESGKIEKRIYNIQVRKLSN